MALSVSFISLCYNHELYVKEHLNTVFKLLRNKDLEIQWIIVDDFSVDKSVQIIEEWLDTKKPLLFKFIKHEKNLGVSKSLNKALSIAVGDYIKILATDDYIIEKSFITQLRDFAKSKSSYGITCSNFVELHKNYRHKIKNSINYSFSKRPYIDLLRLEPAFIHTSTLIYKKVVFESLGVFNERLKQEDYDFLLRVTKKYQVRYFDEMTVVKRVLETSLGSFMFSNEHGNQEVLKVLVNERVTMWTHQLAKLAGICRWGLNYLSNIKVGYRNFTIKNFNRAMLSTGYLICYPAGFLSRWRVDLAFKYLKFIRGLINKALKKDVYSNSNSQ